MGIIQEASMERGFTMNWKTILKTPMFSREESAYLPVDERFDTYLKDFIGPDGRYQKDLEPTKFSWISNDTNARATWSFGNNTIISIEGTKRWIGWDIYIFEIANDHRGQGKAEGYLKELVEEIRNFESQTTIPEPLPIILRQVTEEEMIPFWQRMVDKDIVQDMLRY